NHSPSARLLHFTLRPCRHHSPQAQAQDQSQTSLCRPSEPASGPMGAAGDRPHALPAGRPAAPGHAQSRPAAWPRHAPTPRPRPDASALLRGGGKGGDEGPRRRLRQPARVRHRGRPHLRRPEHLLRAPRQPALEDRPEAVHRGAAQPEARPLLPPHPGGGGGEAREVRRVSVGDRCQQRALYLEELDKGLDVLSGFNLTDLFPTSRLARVLGGGSVRAAWEVRERIQSILDAMVEDHKRAMESEEAAGAGAGHENEDILTTLLRFQRDGGMGGITLTNENVNGVLFDIFSAGSETTATTTVWAMSELIRNPRTMAIAQSEVRRVLQGKTKVAEADIDGQLHYLQMVIKETFRLHPPVPLLLPRLCTEQKKIMGYDVPPGTTVFANVWAIGRDEKSWTDASEFKPERFEVQKVDYGGTNFRFLPGGAGRRMCPGMMFGVSNMEIALASLLYHFDWRLPDGASPEKLDMTEAYGITARRKTNLLLEATVFVP
uniref:Uncharacterized protein n=1 Tax=Aegilops tauschii subsp. strangulata TaxID=200361 RepID=A0A453LWY3_AEGTS